MAYTKKEIYNSALEAIKQHNLFFIEDIIGFLPCVKTTFYKKIKLNSHEMNVIKERLEQNKIKTKSNIRAKLYQSEKAGELLALYRLICTPEERRMLNQQYVEATGKDGKDLIPTTYVIGDDDFIKEFNEKLQAEQATGNEHSDNKT